MKKRTGMAKLLSTLGWISEVILTLPVCMFLDKGRPLGKLLSALQLTLLVGAFGTLFFSVTNRVPKLRVTYLLIALGCVVLAFLCYDFQFTFDLNKEFIVAIVLFMVLPSVGAGLAAIIVNLVKMIFHLGNEASGAASGLPLFLKWVIWVFLALAVAWGILTLIEIYFLRKSEIIISDGCVVLRNGKVMSVELSPHDFSPKNMLKLRIGSGSKEREKVLETENYRVEVDEEGDRMVVRRDGQIIWETKCYEMTLCFNPKGRRMPA